MKLKAFSIYDSKVQAFETPFFLRSPGEAVRGFIDLVQDQKTNICRHPEDFSLFMIGEFDPEKGSIEPYSAPENLGLASNFVQTRQ